MSNTMNTLAEQNLLELAAVANGICTMFFNQPKDGAGYALKVFVESLNCSSPTGHRMLTKKCIYFNRKTN